MELEPKCLNGEQQLAVTNLGHLVPCCQCDTAHNDTCKKYKTFLKDSLIEDYETIDEIFFSDTWIQFAKDLQNNIGFKVCYTHCLKKEEKDHKKMVYYENGKVTGTTKT